jgi:protein-S-isoprenylcysteine O-methyltransferase Ste14
MDTGSGRVGTVTSRLIAIAQVAIQVSVGFGLLVGVPLLAAGRLDWPPAWRLAGLFAVLLGVNLAVLRRDNPELIRKRMQLGIKPRRWDRNVMFALTCAVVGTLVVAGLDARLGWADPLPGSAVALGAALLVVGDLLFLWAMAVNRFFTKVVVIEPENGHRVVDVGPYRLVRHPGYVGWFVMWLGVPLVLASAWALLPAALASGGIVVRTALEDADLAAELPGYRGYAERVRFRLLPGVW